MNDSAIRIMPRKKLQGTVSGTLMAGGDSFVSSPVESLKLDYNGITGDCHSGQTRASGAREPWYPRGTEMRNERQVSILSVEELEEIRTAMGIGQLDAGWIGANLVLCGIPRLSFLPARTILMFEGGVSLRIDGYNAPCRIAGAEIARALGGEAPMVDGKPDFKATDIALDFARAGHMKRGLVAWVEREGEIRPEEAFTAIVWEQWIYQ